MSAPKLFQDEFTISKGRAVFTFVWSDLCTTDDKNDLIEWLELVIRRINRLPNVGPVSPATESKP